MNTITNDSVLMLSTSTSTIINSLIIITNNSVPTLSTSIVSTTNTVPSLGMSNKMIKQSALLILKVADDYSERITSETVSLRDNLLLFSYLKNKA